MKVEQLLEHWDRPKYSSKGVNAAVKTLNTHCKDALWMLHENKPIWRGDGTIGTHMESGFAIADASKSMRRSRNTSNYYTLILDNHPLMEGWPKRSKSFICSTSSDYSEDYGKLYVVVPFDGVKIGAVNKPDIFDTKATIYGKTRSFISWNHTFDSLRLSDKGWDQFTESVFTVKKREFAYEFIRGIYNKYGDWKIDDHEKVDVAVAGFVAELQQAYSPKNTGMTLHTTKNFQGVRGEVWTAGPCMFIKRDMWQAMREVYAESVGIKLWKPKERRRPYW